MNIYSELNGFDWNDANRYKNWKKHHVAWWECEEVFFNQPVYVFPDSAHSGTEMRHYVLGVTNANRPLFIVFTKRGDNIRIISARDMHRKERKAYHEKAKRDSKI